MTARLGMVVDTRVCVGCNACVIACKSENALPLGSYRSWVVTETRGVFPHLEQEIRSERCQHCENAPCVANCPTGASHFGVGGSVQVDPSLCTGCKACMAACPFGARSMHPAGHVDKCSFCAHRVDRGQQPACVSICPTQALHFGDLDDPSSEPARLLRERPARTLLPEAGTRPRLYFLS